jgi:signal transduction histidine kinase
MTPSSLRLRLFSVGALAIIAALILAGAGLVLLFEHHVERTLDDDLDAYVRQIAGRLQYDTETGRFRMVESASDPRFEAGLSGFYWQVSNSRSREVMRSRSLGDVAIEPSTDCIAGGGTHYYRIAGPANQTLLAGERCLSWNGARGPVLVRILAGIDLASVTRARNAFANELIVSLVLLSLVLAIAMWAQVGLGLAPLAKLGAELADIARGRRDRLDPGGPLEIQPLVDEVNGLLDEREKEIERAQNRAADLAHGLKTPLTALAADARLLREKGDLEIAQSLERIGDAMERHVARELVHARAKRVQRGGKPPEAPVREVVEALVRTLIRTGAEVKFETHVDPNLKIAMDRVDLMEALGNLLENASRYAASVVCVSAPKEQVSRRLIIEDDGPGLPEGSEALIRQRGGRLDETGSAGLGLAIVQDVLDAYGFTMKFSRSDLGGLRVSIDFSVHGTNDYGAEKQPFRRGWRAVPGRRSEGQD